jgi:hypothetical protein
MAQCQGILRYPKRIGNNFVEFDNWIFLHISVSGIGKLLTHEADIRVNLLLMSNKEKNTILKIISKNVNNS